LIFLCEPLALQEFNLFLFATAINTKVIKVLSGHAYFCWIGLRCTATKQAGSDNADAKYGNEFAHGSFHMHVHFARVDEEQPTGIDTSL
jgi:hypothetical protein